MRPRRCAEAARARLATVLRHKEHVNGVGLTRFGADWAVKINLDCDDADTRHEIPVSVDGVPVIVEVVGRIAPCAPDRGLPSERVPAGCSNDHRRPGTTRHEGTGP